MRRGVILILILILSLFSVSAAIFKDSSSNAGELPLGQQIIQFFNKLFGLEKTCDYGCLIPDSLNDTTPEKIKMNNEENLQTLLASRGYVLNVTKEQTNIQIWKATKDVQIQIKYLGGIASYYHAFGYYLNSDISTFKPLFRDNIYFPYGMPTAKGNDTFTINVKAGDEIGFAIDSYDSESSSRKKMYTEDNFNYDLLDHAVVFDLCGEYIIAFNDQFTDWDFQDMVVVIKILNCGPLPTCGNGIINQPTEECDAGANNGKVCTPLYNSSCTYCSNECKNVRLTDGYCGDGHLDIPYEQCDDGNNINGDGCDSNCHIETCVPKTCQQLGKVCGSWSDGCGGMLNCGANTICCLTIYGTCIVNGTKICNINGTDYGNCNAIDPRIGNCAGKQCGSDLCGGSCGTCQLNESCQQGICIPQHKCGDGYLDAGEQCDEGEGNTLNGCIGNVVSYCEYQTCKIIQCGCLHDVGVKYSYANTTGTGIRISYNNGTPILSNPAQLIFWDSYKIKYYIDNKINESNNINVIVKINNTIIANYNNPINPLSYSYKELNFNTSRFTPGNYKITLDVSKINETDCNLSDNHAERNIVIIGIPCAFNTDCGNDFCSMPYCTGNGVAINHTGFTCNNPGQVNSYCSNSTTTNLTEECDYGCSQGQCIRCNKNSDCGLDFDSNLFCFGLNVTKNHTTFICNLPGTPLAFCSSTLSQIFVEKCDFICSNGECSECKKNSDCGQIFYNVSCDGSSVVNLTTEPVCLLGVCGEHKTQTIKSCGNISSELVCQGKNVVNITRVPGCGNGECFFSYINQTTKYCQLGCSNGQCNECIPKTCSDLGKICGSWSDGCGGMLNCGPNTINCSSQFGTCNVNGIKECNILGIGYGNCNAQDPRPGNCQELECGSDLCGGSCGNCPNGENCEQGTCVGCVPEPISTTCTRVYGAGYECGTVSNNCNQPVNCGTCLPNENCNNGKCIKENCTIDSDHDGVNDCIDKCPNSKPGEPVDQDGCDIFQFCNIVSCGFGCNQADWKHNEPNTTNPHDCMIVIVEREGKLYPKCVPTEFSDMCAG